MRFVAGRGAVAERLQRGGVVAEMLAAAWRIAIGKKLLPGRTIGKKMLAGDAVAERLSGCAEEVLLAGPPLLHHREAATGREIARHHREEPEKHQEASHGTFGRRGRGR